MSVGITFYNGVIDECESLKSSNAARTIIMPPVRIVKGTVVTYFAGGLNTSCALTRKKISVRIIMYPAL